MTTREPGPASGSAGAAIVDRVILLSRSLQIRGFGISLAETIDAVTAAEAVGLGSRGILRDVLRATLVKGPDERSDFDELFDRIFPLRPAGTDAPEATADASAVAGVLAGDGDLGPTAAALVDEHAGLDGDLRGERHHVQRVLRAADLARLLSDVSRDHEVTPHEARARIEELKRLITAEVRGRLGTPEEHLLGDIEDVEFLHASRRELDAMRRVVQPMARQLAARLARRRRHARAGGVDMRHTIRRSLATGGVPFEVTYRRRSARRPELFVLCDISGSVAEFSLFTLTLMSALSAELPRTRSFVFVDAVDEITDLLSRTAHEIEPWQIMRNTNVIGESGHSDYGTVLEQFWARVGEAQLAASSTVIITGDARSNYRPARPEVLSRIARRARATYWLNPEPATQWGEFDSEMDTYSSHCTETFEVRDLHQLAQCVERIL